MLAKTTKGEREPEENTPFKTGLELHLSDNLNSATTLRELFEDAIAMLIEELNPERAFIGYKDKDSKELIPQGTHGIDPQAIFVTGEISTELIKNVLRDGKPVCLVDAIQHPGYSNRSSVILSGLRSIICVPIMHPSGLSVGLIYADNRLKAGAFSDEHMEKVVKLAETVASRLVPLLKQAHQDSASHSPHSAGPADEEQWKRVRAEGIKAFQEGNKSEASRCLHEACSLAEGFGERDPRLAKSLGELAELQRQQGDISQAQKLLIRAIEIFEKLGDHHHPDLAPNLNNLAGVYYAQGNGVRAEGLYLRALDIWKSVIARDDKRLAPVYYNLGTLRKANGAFPEAEKFYQRALEIAEKHWGASHAHTQKCRASYEEAQQLAKAKG